MSQIDVNKPSILLEDIVALSHRAGEAILEVYKRDFDIETKDDKSPLTEADLASHHIIVDGLKALTPDTPILSEESKDISYDERKQWSLYWLVDPLDGTKEFIKKNGEFTVNIALIHDGKPILGVVYVPVKNITYSAATDTGSYKESAGERLPINVRECDMSKVYVVGSRSHRGDSLNAFLEKIGNHEIVSMGSSLKICLVAEGAADIYPRLGPTSEWDTAAAQCVVECASGKLVDTDSRPLRYNQKDSLLNPFFIVYGDDKVEWSKYFS